MAGDGALLFTKEAVFLANVPKGKLVNSVGAGDSVVAGFLAGISKQLPLEDAFRLELLPEARRHFLKNSELKSLYSSFFLKLKSHVYRGGKKSEDN